MNTLKNFKVAIFFSSISLLISCGGGSSSGSEQDLVIPDSISQSGRIGVEFVRTDCIGTTLIPIPPSGGSPTTRVTNSCNEDINYREIINDQFGPTRFIAASSTVTVPDTISLPVACLAPRIPGGVADRFQFQCLL